MSTVARVTGIRCKHRTRSATDLPQLIIAEAWRQLLTVYNLYTVLYTILCLQVNSVLVTQQVPGMTTGLPSRWAMNTEDAIRSGVGRTLAAGIKDFMSDWWKQHYNRSLYCTVRYSSIMFSSSSSSAVKICSSIWRTVVVHYTVYCSDDYAVLSTLLY
jgi:hypothetical protein